LVLRAADPAHPSLAWLRLNRPAARNAWTPEMIAAFLAHIDALDARAVRPATAGFCQRRDRIGIAGKQSLHAAVSPIAHKARQAAHARLARRPLAKANALHFALDAHHTLQFNPVELQRREGLVQGLRQEAVTGTATDCERRDPATGRAVFLLRHALPRRRAPSPPLETPPGAHIYGGT
jgi:hypothetical protein